MNKPWTVIDLFSGVGGMSYGFHVHPKFKIVGAVDAQISKPSSKRGSLQCNIAYQANMGLEPLDEDISTLEPKNLRKVLTNTLGTDALDVLISCAPCTGFSRTLPENHLLDDPRNSFITRNALFVKEFRPTIFLMENARELLVGNFTHHYQRLQEELIHLGYQVHGKNYLLNRFGLPQRRERALVLAVREDLTLRTLDDLWSGFHVRLEATHVRRAISSLSPIAAGQPNPKDFLHIAPGFSEQKSLKRLQMIPKDGGSWADIRHCQEARDLLNPAMLRHIAKGKLGSHPDVYGRLSWDKPAVTIKRECAHIGNGRYSHPEQDRLCTVREMSILQGFPRNYKFVASGLANMYRQIGDAVPPLISYQLAHVCEWILSGKKPSISSVILAHTHLKPEDIESECDEQQTSFKFPSTISVPI
ncbi:DNA (cytosine-5-)-methyltransferase [Scytonema sp. UIC 10036]|uniref:DNA cytosine methyltransferase n=1 Tax=Scytonema sp. UIC 10036 TaxID=2304196 RepID=UPI0012DA4323|nr:DNA cytosine methyltransferase [Scytonema sp. UIC 10036]MUG92053.1 DNA (cytosine-5-)-methyltransferase [Scytonema sp. UIC 10036]